MEERKRLGASVTVLLALVAVGSSQAAPFDEKLKTPRVASSQALRTKLEAHFATYQRKQQDADPAAFIRDGQAYRQWSDLYFAVQLAMDERTPLKGLEAFGLVAKSDGKYVVDLHAFPQWEPLDARLYRLTNPEILESYVPALKARGFRDEDVGVVQTYVATHDPQLSLHTEGRQLVDTFAKRLQAQRQGGQRPNLQEVLAYRYQKSRLRSDVERRWAVGLMDLLDRQRQRILVSFLDEFHGEMTFGVASDALDETLEREAAPILSGEYVHIITNEEAQLRRDMERRTQKLIGGEQR